MDVALEDEQKSKQSNGRERRRLRKNVIIT
jgi:hypothetical protein